MMYSLLYVDPGSGSYLIQLIIAGILGALFCFKSMLWKIKSFFIRKKKNMKDKDHENG